MKRMVKRLVMGLMLPLATLSASSWCDCGDWTVGADLLIWTHTDCTFRWALSFTSVSLPTLPTPPTMEPVENNTTFFPCVEVNVEPGFDFGVRIHGRFDRDCLWTKASYTWIEIADVEPSKGLTPADLNGSLVVNFVSTMQRGSGKIRSRYQNVNLELGREFYSGCRGRFGLYGNARWVDINHLRAIDAFADNLPPELSFADSCIFRLPYTFHGGGCGLGIESRVDVCGGFSAFGNIGLMGLVGEQKFSNVFDVLFVQDPLYNGMPNPFFEPFPGIFWFFDVPEVKRTCFVPGFDMSIGLAYQWQCGCATIEAQASYELQYYVHAISLEPGLPLTEFSNNQQNIGYGGPTLSIRVGY